MAALNDAMTDATTEPVKTWKPGTEETSDSYNMEDIKKTFEKDFCDEIEDCNKYHKMAQAAKALGKEELAEGLMDVAYDEYTHAKFIHMMLSEWSCEIPEKSLMKWHALKERAEHIFR